jgi:hypothetical protein
LAQSGEHKMLFDVRGRRRRVIQVVYALLAFIMAASLFFVVGPVNLGGLVGDDAGDASSVFDDQIQNLERKLAKDPRNEDLLLQDVRIRYSAGNAGIETDPSGAQTGITEEGLENFRRAGDAWVRYIELNPAEPNPNVAQLAATALLYSSTVADLDTRVKDAAEAQAIFAAARPSANSYITLAQYRFLAGDVKGGEQAGQKAKQEAPAQQRPQVQAIINQYQTQSEQLRKEAERAAKAQGDAGKQALENPKPR